MSCELTDLGTLNKLRNVDQLMQIGSGAAGCVPVDIFAQRHESMCRQCQRGLRKGDHSMVF